MGKILSQQKLLFQDKDIKITNNYIYIKWYFFPWAGTKIIAIKDIKKVEKRQLGPAKYRLWGMSISQWGYFLAGDKNRFSRDFFIGITVDSSIKPSFTTENTDKVYKLIKELVQGENESQPIRNSSQKEKKDVELKKTKL